MLGRLNEKQREGTRYEMKNKQYRMTIRKDGTVRFWNVLNQVWSVRPDVFSISHELLATFSENDRARIQKAKGANQ